MNAHAADFNPAAQRLDGTWMVTVARINLPPQFLSLMTYLPYRTLIETSNTGRTNRGPAFGE